jgi:hypothetical protein
LEKIKPEIIYISKTKTLDELKHYILKLKKIQNFYEKEDEIDNLRLWKFLYNSDSSFWKETIQEFSKVKKELNETIEKITYEKIRCLEGK